MVGADRGHLGGAKEAGREVRRYSRCRAELRGLRKAYVRPSCSSATLNASHAGHVATVGMSDVKTRPLRHGKVQGVAAHLLLGANPTVGWSLVQSAPNNQWERSPRVVMLQVTSGAGNVTHRGRQNRTCAFTVPWMYWLGLMVHRRCRRRRVPAAFCSRATGRCPDVHSGLQHRVPGGR